MPFESIIPNTSKHDRDVERVTAFPELPIDGLGSFLDPKKIDARFLPWLAFRLSVDIWSDGWSEEKKRDVVSQAFDLIRLKGTVEGMRRMLNVADAELIQTLTYPVRTFATGAITKEQRNEWLSRMPQVRIYFATEKGQAGPSAFIGAKGFLGRMFARFDAAEAIYGRRAVLRQPDGQETPIRRSKVTEVTETRTAVQVERVHIPGEAGPALFVGGFLRRGFVTDKNKQAEIITYSLDRTYDFKTSELHLSTVKSGLDPISVNYERGSDRLPRGPAFFCSGFVGHGFLMNDDAANHLFDRIYLHDPGVDAPWTRAHSFVGHARLGMKKFHAELLVKTRSKSIRRALYGGLGFVGHSFAIKENLSKTKLAYAAARRSKAARDRVKMETQTMRPITLGDGFKLGDGVKFGSKIKNRLR